MAISFSYDTTTVIINRNPSFSSRWWRERINNTSLDTADGGRTTYDNGPNILKGEIELLAVSKSEGDSFRSFIETTILYGAIAFTITPPSNTDIGAGLGTAISSAYLDNGASTESIFEFIAPGRWNIRFKYRVVS